MKVLSFILLASVILISELSFSQNLLSFIPSDAKSIKCVDGAKLSSKIDFDDVAKLKEFIDYEANVIDKITEKWYALPVYVMYQGYKFGVNTKTKYYRYSIVNDSVDGGASIFELTDANKFQDKMMFWLEDDYEDMVHSKNDFTYFLNEDLIVAWSKEYLIILDVEFDYQYLSVSGTDEDYYIEDLSESEKSKRELQRNERKKALLEKEFEKLQKLGYEKSILSETKFIKVLSKDCEAFEYSSNVSLYPRSRRSYSSYENYSKLEDNEPINNNHRVTSFNLNDNTLKTEQAIFLSDGMGDKLEQCIKTSFNKDYFKYINCTDPLAFISVSLSLKGIFKLMRDLKFSPSSFLPGSSSSKKVTNVMLQLLDRKKVMNIFKGHAMLVVTGTKDISVRYESLNYTDDGDRERIIKTREEQLAEYVFMVETGEKEVVKGFLESMADDGDADNLGSYYRFSSARNSYSAKTPHIDTYCAIVNNVVIISNNEKLIINAVKGKQNEFALNDKWKKEMTKHSLNAYTNVELINDIDGIDGNIGLPRSVERIFRAYRKGYLESHGSGIFIENDKATLNNEVSYDKEDNSAILDVINTLTALDSRGSFQYFQF